MIGERYKVEASPENLIFEFVSTGPKGNIMKAVHYTPITGRIYNLGFGDKDFGTGEINDTIVTNNQDSKKVLLTVAATLYPFTSTYPNISVFAAGSTPARTRLYQIAITNNFEEISKDFYIYGLRAGDWELFQANEQYAGFLVERKN